MAEWQGVPIYYEVQGRHYMAAMDVDRVFFCCLYGNTEDEVIIREIRRDMEYEQEMICLEQSFWENHVLAKNLPPYTEESGQIRESLHQYCGPADAEAPAVKFGMDMTTTLMRYLQLQEERKNAEVRSKELEAEIKRMKAILVAEMETSCKAVSIEHPEVFYLLVKADFIAGCFCTTKLNIADPGRTKPLLYVSGLVLFFVCKEVG